MATPMAASKESIWLSCEPKTCCYSAFVIPTGRDIWRISRILEAPPWSFIVYFEPPRPRPDAFILDNSGRQFCLALAKQKSRRKTTPPPCIFLLKSRDGHHRCGLGGLRPQVCQSFPLEIIDGMLATRPNPGCTCRKWALSDVDMAAEMELAGALQADFNEYISVVSYWNEMVAEAPPEATFTFFDFCEFLLSAYDSMAEEEEVAQ